MDPQLSGIASQPEPPRRVRPRTGFRRLFLLVLVLLPLLGSSVGNYSAPPNIRGDELSDAQARAKALAAKIAAQKAQLAKLTALQTGLATDIAQTKSTLAGVNADLSVVQARVKKMAGDVAAVQATYVGLVAEIDSLDAQLGRIAMAELIKTNQLNERKGILGERLRAAYTAGDESLLETILSANSFADALADLGYYLDIGDQDKALAEQIAADEQALADLQQTVTDTRTQEDTLRIATAAQKVQLDGKLADLKQARKQLAHLQAATKHQLALQAQAYSKLHLSKVATAAVIAKAAHAQSQIKIKIAALIAAQFARGNIPSVYNGTLVWPLSGVVTQEFGCTGFWAEPPLGSCAHFHTGIDIAADMYTPIRSAGSGQVVYEGPLSDGAWVVIVAHSQSLVTMYAHLDNRVFPPTVRSGEVVSQGQIVGYVGVTGNSTGPHLHWGVELNGNWVNPRLFL
jgi:murein DD-endopeptidase MepM/ murein hydrolase activator NlpD